MSPPPPQTVEQPQACSIMRINVAAPLQRQNTCRWCLLEVPSAPASACVACRRQRRALTVMSPPPPRTIEQPQPCPIRRSCMVAPLQRQNTCRCLFGVPASETRTHLDSLSPSPPRTVEQPQACPIRRMFMAAPLQRQIPASACLECRRQTRALTVMSPPPPRTIEQPQAACGSVAKANTCMWCLFGVPTARGSVVRHRRGRPCHHSSENALDCRGGRVDPTMNVILNYKQPFEWRPARVILAFCDEDSS